METYLPNSIKKVSPSVAKTDETNIFKGCSVELTKKDDKWDFSENFWNFISSWFDMISFIIAILKTI